MDRHQVDGAVGEFLRQHLVAGGDRSLDVVADHLGRAGGDDGDDAQFRITPRQDLDPLDDPLRSAEHRRLLVHRAGGDGEVLLEVLGEQQPHEHRATLATVDERDTILDADAGVLAACRLAGVHGIDNSCAFLACNCAGHDLGLLMGARCGNSMGCAARPASNKGCGSVRDCGTG